jgi:hypothetical protein
MEFLEDWYFGVLDASPYLAPEAVPKGFVGRLDGKIVGIVPSGPAVLTKEGTMITDKEGIKYLLGEPLAAYEEAYPNCKQRVVINKV